MLILPTHMEFNLGKVVVTADALSILNADDVMKVLNRHASGDRDSRAQPE